MLDSVRTQIDNVRARRPSGITRNGTQRSGLSIQQAMVHIRTLRESVATYKDRITKLENDLAEALAKIEELESEYLESTNSLKITRKSNAVIKENMETLLTSVKKSVSIAEVVIYMSDTANVTPDRGGPTSAATEVRTGTRYQHTMSIS